jgi:hypothetical protein
VKSTHLGASPVVVAGAGVINTRIISPRYARNKKTQRTRRKVRRGWADTSGGSFLIFLSQKPDKIELIIIKNWNLFLEFVFVFVFVVLLTASTSNDV